MIDLLELLSHEGGASIEVLLDLALDKDSNQPLNILKTQVFLYELTWKELKELIKRKFDCGNFY